MSDESKKVVSKPAARKPWGGRFQSDTDPTVERFSASIHFDLALAQHDLRLSRAHAAMLRAQGLISAEDEASLQQGLDRVEAEVREGSLRIDPALEDIHMHVEARLGELVGTPAGRLHTGRSRNDQVATDLLLYLRETSKAAQRGLHEVRGVLVDRAREHLDTVLPGYTHLQRAQPVRLAHHWLAFVEMFGRDASRFHDLTARFRHSPLGSGALAGTTLPLDRESTAAALGFEGPSRNSMDAVASRDAGLEFLSACAITAVHLSRIAEELVLWSSAEFGFIELADAYSTGSSLMPQKKNPDVPELVRGKSGRVIGNLVTLPGGQGADLRLRRDPAGLPGGDRRGRCDPERRYGAHARGRIGPDVARHGSRRDPGPGGRALSGGPRSGRASGRALRRHGERPPLALQGRSSGLPPRLPGQCR
jgi:argininosuccinate lyase